MSESEAPLILKPIRKEDVMVESDPDPGPTPDPIAEYHKAVRQLEQNPNDQAALAAVQKPIKDHLEAYSLQLYTEDPILLTYKGAELTDFGIILLANVQQHVLDGILHYMRLLVISEYVPPKIVQVKLSEIGSSKWIDALGPKYFYERGSSVLIEVLLRIMAKYAPDIHEYLYNGWSVDGENLYVMDGLLLGGDNWAADKARGVCLHALNMLDVASHSLTIPLLAAALLSLVHSRLMEQGDYFKGVLCITALTQSFKTTLASLFFDFKNGREATVNFEATITAIVRSVGNNRDSVAIVDDYKPGASRIEANSMVGKLSKIVRMASDNSGGIQKAGTGNSTISNIARGLVAVTAEPFQLEVQSTLARLLILEMNRKDVDVEKLTYLQNNHQQYQAFIQDFICYIASQGVDEYCRKLIQKFRNERNTLRGKLKDKTLLVDNRTSDMCTWLWLSFGEFLNYSLSVGAITKEQFERYSSESQTVFTTVMQHQAERVAELGPIQQFFLGLRVLLDTNVANIQKLQARNAGFGAIESKETIGFSKGGYIYMKNGVAIQTVVDYWLHNGRDFIMSETALRKALADSGYIIPANEKTYIHRLNINGARYQCIKFKEEKFYELCRKNDNSGDVEEIQGDRGKFEDALNLLGRGV